MVVAVLGASSKPERYSNKAVKLLAEKGHEVYPIHPALADIDGIPVYKRLVDAPEPIDTVTVYLSAKNSAHVAEDLVDCGARRVIFNPGAENPELAGKLRGTGMRVLEACTLVLLKTGQFRARQIAGLVTRSSGSATKNEKLNGAVRANHWAATKGMVFTGIGKSDANHYSHVRPLTTVRGSGGTHQRTIRRSFGLRALPALGTGERAVFGVGGVSSQAVWRCARPRALRRARRVTGPRPA